MIPRFPVSHMRLFIASIGRVVDSIIWMLTFGFFRTNVHANLLFWGDSSTKQKPWFASTPAEDRVTFIAKDSEGQGVNRYSHAWHMLLALILFVDGLISVISIGFAESNFNEQLKASRLWSDNVSAGVKMSSFKTVQ